MTDELKPCKKCRNLPQTIVGGGISPLPKYNAVYLCSCEAIDAVADWNERNRTPEQPKQVIEGLDMDDIALVRKAINRDGLQRQEIDAAHFAFDRILQAAKAYGER